MKEYQNKIEIAPLEDISSISGTTLTLTSGKTVDVLFSNNDILPDEQHAEKDGSFYYSYILNVFTDKNAEALNQKYRDRKVVIKLFTSENVEVLLGNMNFPARCQMLPNLNSDTLKISGESSDPILP